MDFFHFLAIAILAAQLLATSFAKETSGLRRAEDSITCLLVEVSLLRADGKEEIRWCCVFEEEQNAVYEIEGLPHDFFESKRTNISSAETLMTVSSPVQQSTRPGAGILSSAGVQKMPYSSPYVLAVPPGSDIDIEKKTPGNDRKLVGTNIDSFSYHQRSLVQKMGTSSVLAVRVSDKFGESPTRSATEISDDIFGTHGDPYNLVSFVTIWL